MEKSDGKGYKERQTSTDYNADKVEQGKSAAQKRKQKNGGSNTLVFSFR